MKDKSTFQNAAFQIQWKCFPMLQKQAHSHENYIIAKHSLLQGGLVIHTAAYAHVQNAGIPSEPQQSEEAAHPSRAVPSKYEGLDGLCICVHST